MIEMFLSAGVQVLLVSLIVGAGLPAVFAIGVRTLATGAGAGASEATEPVISSRGKSLATALGICCFVLVVMAVALGITIIVADGFGKTVSFEHIIPLLVDQG